MKIWVDADACPREARAVLLRASQRVQVPVVLVSNHPLGVPDSEFVSSIIVPPRADAADLHIVKEIQKGDLVITADIPLAAEAVECGARVIDTRGVESTEDDVRARLSQRNFMESLRSAGIETGGPPGYGDVDKQKFAAALDRILTRYQRERDRRVP